MSHDHNQVRLSFDLENLLSLELTCYTQHPTAFPAFLPVESGGKTPKEYGFLLPVSERDAFLVRLSQAAALQAVIHWCGLTSWHATLNPHTVLSCTLKKAAEQHSPQVWCLVQVSRDNLTGLAPTTRKVITASTIGSERRTKIAAVRRTPA